ncbi:MAG: GNAT family N-acetyltransferase [Pseudomonadota bacterium]
MRTDVSLTSLHRSDAAWLHAQATAYFRELVPDVPGPEMIEIEHWFDDPDCYTLLISVAHDRVGFALIDRMKDHHELAEFCVFPNWRNAGIGTQAVALCFERFPGPWTLGVASASSGTARFWDRFLTEHSGIQDLVRGAAFTPYQSHSYSFTIRDQT